MSNQSVTAADGHAFAIVGYLPAYRFAAFDFERAELATDVVLFSIEPREDGGLNETRLPADPLPQTVAKLQSHRCRVHVTVGGWGQSAAFATVTADDRLRHTFIRNLADYCERHGLNGLDIDWEHPRTDAERANYGRFLHELQSALAPHHRSLSIAVAPWERLAAESIAAVDRIHLMAYDNGGRHSTPEYAREAIDRLIAQDVPAAKICLGVPFYGRPFQGNFGAARTYAEIAAVEEISPQTDELDGFYFNGPETMTEKVELARDRGLGGVMIWELGQDHPRNERSLLHVIHSASRRPAVE